MIEMNSYAELVEWVGKDLGTSAWMTIDQALIDQFAEVTGDYVWLHVDRERAAKELEGGRTIAHGLLTFSLIPKLLNEIVRFPDSLPMLSYGADRLRYVSPVREGEAVRLSARVSDTQRKGDRTHVILDYVMEIRGKDRPALVATQVYVLDTPPSPAGP